jgi:2-methylisocitrate lyase-like PEP mutase family enzyme
MTIDRKAQARDFRALHTNGPLVLPNAWDPGSARAIEAAGAKAVATTSAGVSWAEGVADAGGLSRDAALAVLRRIVQVISVPLTADLESGYGETAAEVGQTVAEVIEIGVVGINLEDSVGHHLVDAAILAERIAAAREAAVASGIDLVINARTDTHLFGDGSGMLE